MDVRRQGQSNEHYQEPVAATPVSSHRGGGMGSGMGMHRGMAWLISAVAVVVLAWFALQAFGAVTADAAIKGNEYQALFLTNGQVYFGKLSAVNSQYVKLTDIFYLQVQQSVQPSSSSSSNSGQQVSLAKLGGELHGPEDEMFVAKDQVLFWENLKNSGKVATAIANYKAGGGK